MRGVHLRPPALETRSRGRVHNRVAFNGARTSEQGQAVAETGGARCANSSAFLWLHAECKQTSCADVTAFSLSRSRFNIGTLSQTCGTDENNGSTGRARDGKNNYITAFHLSRTSLLGNIDHSTILQCTAVRACLRSPRSYQLIVR